MLVPVLVLEHSVLILVLELYLSIFSGTGTPTLVQYVLILVLVCRVLDTSLKSLDGFVSTRYRHFLGTNKRKQQSESRNCTRSGTSVTWAYTIDVRNRKSVTAEEGRPQISEVDEMSLEVSNVVVCMVITEQHHLDDLVMWVQLHEEQVNIGRQP